MEGFNNVIGFARVLDSNGNTIRYIDITKNTKGIGSIRDPYFFMYENLTNSEGTNYELPSEGFNHPSAIESTRLLSPLDSKDKTLYHSNAFLPQLNPSQDSTDVTEIGSFTTVRTERGYFINVYLILYPGETKVEFYMPSKDNTDSYGLSNPDNTKFLYSTDDLDHVDKLRSIILGVNISQEEWNWKDPVVDSVKRPIYWVDRADTENVNKLPSRLKELREYENPEEGYINIEATAPAPIGFPAVSILRVGNRRFPSSSQLMPLSFLTNNSGGPVEQ